MLTSDFDFHLPEELIASEPLADRSASRLMVVNRAEGTIEHRRFAELPSLLRPTDLLVLNNSRVVPARFYDNTHSKELLRIESITPTRWRCMVKPGKKLRIGNFFPIGEATGEVVGIEENGDRIIEFDRPVDEGCYGHLALPPYMKREDREDDRERYQTVFAEHDGSLAAPTAGLHFTPEILKKLPHVFVTLHVGVGTFQPVKAERLEEHVMHDEQYSLEESTAEKIRTAERVVSVGTTATRVLESVAAKHGQVTAGEGRTNIFIHPPYQFRVVDVLITNFHLPKSTLLMLVSAFAGRELILRAYEEAIQQRYRFYSYGDCMLIL